MSYLRDRAFEIGRFLANAFLLVMGLAGLASWCALILMLAGCQKKPTWISCGWVEHSLEDERTYLDHWAHGSPWRCTQAEADAWMAGVGRGSDQRTRRVVYDPPKRTPAYAIEVRGLDGGAP